MGVIAPWGTHTRKNSITLPPTRLSLGQTDLSMKNTPHHRCGRLGTIHLAWADNHAHDRLRLEATISLYFTFSILPSHDTHHLQFSFIKTLAMLHCFHNIYFDLNVSYCLPCVACNGNWNRIETDLNFDIGPNYINLRNEEIWMT